ncbi:MAG: Ribosomal RNA small subunit methyltransferase A [Berkelbacteria bacterium GW2011_GWA2_35_9]|uniref:Ribosomal RNA small subunit methyltransferase A n=1 Tax=Berkelbacteria bacterium GW2011_GWA2_35_9 TaxID=1618333 RepID=A0A0G0D6N7_9BACT|nr:MAG: Ribosomal RNA small subunit methyltransferase A [Berkelbacteria bacterium GW2011_GWA2_35_9]
MKTKLSQNFLTNQIIAQQIVEAIESQTGDKIIEIGPGRGALTDLLIEKPIDILALEKDFGIAEKLKKVYKNRKNIKVVNRDALEFNSTDLARFTKNDYKLISNLPYAVTSPIINKYFVTGEIEKPTMAVLMVQKEVAERLASKAGEKNRGILSVFLQYYYAIEILFEVSKENFQPIPQVDSAVIKLSKKNNITPLEVGMMRLIKAGFSQKRRKLINSLFPILNFDKTDLFDIMEKSQIKEGYRAEDLTVLDWQNLYTILKNNLDN